MVALVQFWLHFVCIINYFGCMSSVTKTSIDCCQSNICFLFILHRNRDHLIPLQLKTKAKCFTDHNLPHLDRQGEELI